MKKIVAAHIISILNLLGITLLCFILIAEDAAAKSRKRRRSRRSAPEPALIRLTSTTEQERLRECSDRIAGELRRYERGTFGIVIQTDSGDEVYSRNANLLLKPASNLKLVTSAVVLEKLGSSYRYQTEFFYDGTITDGVLHGDLIICGSTDPILSGYFDSRIDDITRTWADTLLARGVTRIDGHVVLDNSIYYGNDFEKSSGNLKFETVASFSHADERQLAKVSRIRTIKTRKGIIKKVRTGFRRRSKLKMVSIQPNMYAMETFMTALQERHITVQSSFDYAGLSKKLDRTAWRHFYTHYSLSLGEAIKIVNKNSDNFYADQVLRTLGYELRGAASIEKGIDVVREFLTMNINAAASEFQLKDGSGLSHDNHVTPALLVRVMKYMKKNSLNFHQYYESLSVPTVDGTLAGRISHELARNIRAKTGTISGVISLSGYLTSRNGTCMTFSIIGNDTGRKRKRTQQVEDRICKYLLEI
jgi:serine-type D-Ala-D-Ala carboxypeptidase/endopeptidase (penicillin-binding protein 4)